MKQLSIMIKPASSLCNLRCRYCFYTDEAKRRSIPSHGVMREETVEALLASVASELDPGDCVRFIFQGGEPMLAGLPFFRSFVARVALWQNVTVFYALQTNGIFLTDEWAEFLKENRFLVGVSLDLYRRAHDEARLDPSGAVTYQTVCNAIAILKRHAVDFNLLSTLTKDVAKHPREVWEEILRLDVDYVQFTPCLGELDGTPSPYALTPALFASFYTELFSLWYTAFCKGERRSVKLFDDVVNLLLLGTPTSCGMDGNCRGQLVIEANGDAYPCDFYCLDEYRLGNIKEAPPSALLGGEAMKCFLTRMHQRNAACRDCPYRRFCGGGCPRMRREVYCTDRADLCGYRLFLDKCGLTLLALARAAREAYTKQAKGEKT